VDEAPRYLIRDRDAVYGSVVTRRLRAMGIRDKPISAGSPWQNCFAERLIGTIRRECVDHLMVLGEAHLRRVLVEFTAYYNGSRIHHSLGKDAPFHRPIERVGSITARSIFGGLHHQYCRVESAYRMRFSAHTSFEKEQVSHEKKTTPSPSEAESTASTDGRRKQR